MANTKTAGPKPFKINVPAEQLDWITQRVKTTRIPPGKKTLAASSSEDTRWSYGLPPDVARKIHRFWSEKYDWRAVEAELNQELDMFLLPIRDGDEGAEEEILDIHFVHHRAKDSKDAIPLLFLHGWPGSFLEVRRIIDKLTNPSKPGDQAYHVIAPSLPGYGFSSYPSSPCSPMRAGRIMDKLMKALGYDKYMLQGGDWGSLIGRVHAAQFPDSCIALHLNMVFVMPPEGGDPMAGLTDREKAGLARMKWWMDDESGYSAIQGTKPQTISYGLTDSPFGMVCWIRDKLHHLVDEYPWDEEEVITWCMPYIINGTPGHAEIYKWIAGAAEKQEYFAQAFGEPIPKSVAVGCSLFPKDACYCPRSWSSKLAENIVFWSEHDNGGHFASVEKPDELVEDIRAFTKDIDEKTLTSLKQAGA